MSEPGEKIVKGHETGEYPAIRGTKVTPEGLTRMVRFFGGQVETGPRNTQEFTAVAEDLDESLEEHPEFVEEVQGAQEAVEEAGDDKEKIAKAKERVQQTLKDILGEERYQEWYGAKEESK